MGWMLVFGTGPAAPTSLPVGGESVFDLVVKGGPVMIPIGVCSLVALAVVVERGLQLRRSRVIPPGLYSSVRGALRDRSKGPAAALELCKAGDSPAARVLATAIKRMDEPEELLERHIQEAGEREVPGLRKRLRLLSVIGSVATLLGLLGTITGMITAFQTVAAAPEALGRTQLLAKGIYEAMVTTAAGLIVAIPTVILYQWLSGRVEALVQQIDRVAVEFVEEFARRGGRAREGGDSAAEAAADEREPAGVLAGAA